MSTAQSEAKSVDIVHTLLATDFDNFEQLPHSPTRVLTALWWANGNLRTRLPGTRLRTLMVQRMRGLEFFHWPPSSLQPLSWTEIEKWHARTPTAP